MTDEATAEAVAGAAPQAKRGMPRVSLAVAETYAGGVWEAARLGAAPQVSVARAISGKDDATASGGNWRAKVAALRIFHLIETPGGQMKLSEIGLSVVNSADPHKQREARRRAVLAVEPYAAVLQQSAGHPLPPAASLAGRFEFDYGLSKDDAKIAADAFIASAKHAEILDAAGVVSVGGELPAPPDGDPNDEVRTTEASGTDEVPAADAAPVVANADVLAAQPIRPPVVGGAGSVEIAVTINMTKWPVEDVLTVLDVFGYGSRSAHDE